ncbi:TadE/TadG family type IV pilus assembly protein [Cohnella lupini]|uniref:TadE-like protein n=1 Tax=Cohnella lupini TaxID=1294267 RepID=A0A3D9IMV4_9BACL|nr:TadE family protein [Cohnella lupini]RED63017.1 TadE-like protein [Cohnella lupini]
MKFRRNEKGSITLEAAMVLPLFLAFVLCLITVIRMTILQMALQNATSEMTKLVATHIYPVSLAYDTYQNSAFGKAIQEAYQLATSSEARTDKAGELIDGKIDQLITDPITNGLKTSIEEQGIDPIISTMITDFVRDNILSIATNELKERVKDEALSPAQGANESLEEFTKRIQEEAKTHMTRSFNNAVRPFVMSFVDSTLIDKNNLEITQLTLPNLGGDQQNFGVEVEYTYKLIVPFISYDLKLSSTSLERVWSGI